MQITLQTLTPLWTGGIDQTSDRLHETGLIGSLRWWYEALVRGLGGYACDPTSEGRCEYKPNDSKSPEEQLCAACYLFGCTGWGRKFRLRILNDKSQLVQEALQENTKFTLDFIELRFISPEEKWLLAKAVKVAAKYGALGGKTTLKPQKGPMGEDYGITKWIDDSLSSIPSSQDIVRFLQGLRKGNNLQQYPDLRYFFFFEGAYLTRVQMNPLLGLNEKGKPLLNKNEIQRFLRGRRGQGQQDAISKKIFSFKAAGGRIWGYAKDAHMRDKIIEEITQQLNIVGRSKTGEEALNEL